MLKIAICDDEDVFAKKLGAIIKKNMEQRNLLYEIDFFSSGVDLINTGLEMINYAIIFLDINMEQMDGIEVAKKIREISNEPYLVFVTAFINYAPVGYSVDAIRYILKRKDKFEDYVNECIEAIMIKMNLQETIVETDFIECKKRYPLCRLIYIESRLHKLEYHILENSETIYTQYQTLNDVEKNFQDGRFLRVHQSFLVNMQMINSIICKNGKKVVVMQNGMEINIPKMRYRDVKETFIAYKGEI